MMPLGRWEEPVKALAARGLLKALDPVNYIITPAGVDALKAQEKLNQEAVDKALVGVMQDRNEILRLVERAAHAIYEASKLTSRLSGRPFLGDVEKVFAAVRDRTIKIWQTKPPLPGDIREGPNDDPPPPRAA